MLAACLLAGCAPTTECSLARVTDLPLDLENGHLVTSVEINGSPARMVVDTGSFGTVLTREGIARLHLPRPDWVYGAGVTGIGGSRSFGTLSTATFKLGAMHGEDLQFGALDGKGVMGDLAADGILGMDLLGQVDVDFDWPDHKLILYRAVKGCRLANAALDPPLYKLPMVPHDEDRTPLVSVEIAGKRLQALLDSGSPVTALYRRTARRIGLQKTDLTASETGTTGGIGPDDVRTWRHVVAPVAVGDITISNMPVDILDQRSEGPDDMILGLDFFSRVHLWLSFSSQTVIMQFPPKSSPPAP